MNENIDYGAVIEEMVDITVTALQRVAEAITELWDRFCRCFVPVARKWVEGFFRISGIPKRYIHLAFHAKKHRIRKKNMRRCIAYLGGISG